VTDRIEVAVPLEVVVVLGLVGGVKVVLAVEVCEDSSLSELYCLALYMVMGRGVVAGCLVWTLW
jgi:hypothetical protein